MATVRFAFGFMGFPLPLKEYVANKRNKNWEEASTLKIQKIITISNVNFICKLEYAKAVRKIEFLIKLKKKCKKYIYRI